MKIIIPSTGRAKSVSSTVDMVGGRTSKRCIVYVPENEVEEYTEYIPKSIIKPVSMDVYGLGATLKYMVNDNRDQDYIFQLDDDVTYIKYKFSDKIQSIIDPKHVLEVIDNVYQMANDIGCPLFGFMVSPTPKYYTQLNHFSFNGIVSMGRGIIYKHLGDINFDERFLVKSDIDLWLHVKAVKRYVFLDHRYNLVYGDTWTAEGGCSKTRTTETINACIELLQKKYGKRVVQRHKEKPHQLTIHVGY